MTSIALVETKNTYPVRQTSVVFVGTMPTVARHTVRLLRSEYPEAEFHHVPEIGHVPNLEDGGCPLAMVVVAEILVDRLIADPVPFVEAADGARIVLAYRDAEAAARLIGAMSDYPALAEVGLLPLDVSVEVLLSCVHLLLCGEIFYPRSMVDMLVSPPKATSAEAMPSKRLTPREWQILTKITEGLQNKQIAADLDVSEHTVKLHVHHVLKKLGVANRTGAARWYATYGASS